MKNKILLFVFGLMIFFTGLSYGSAKTLEEVKEYNVKALENYSFDFKYTNQDDNIKRNVDYLKEQDEFVLENYDSYVKRYEHTFKRTITNSTDKKEILLQRDNEDTAENIGCSLCFSVVPSGGSAGVPV